MQSFIEQLKRVLADQRQDLAEVRKKRREHKERIAELDVEEIELLLGIEKTEEILENLRREGAC